MADPWGEGRGSDAGSLGGTGGIPWWILREERGDPVPALSRRPDPLGSPRIPAQPLSPAAVLQSWSIQQDGPISKVLLFPLPSAPEVDPGAAQPYGLLVTSAIELSVVYRDVLAKGLGDQLILPASDQHDSVLCALVTDIDFDGSAEILLGTYGQELLCYKYDSPGQFRLVWTRRFPSPLLSMLYADLTADGVCELAVVCLKGLHVLQHSLEPTARQVLERLRRRARRRREEGGGGGDDAAGRPPTRRFSPQN
ncbi:KICSTOR complex protein kaptin isoform X2 [Larus michahellis]|uniref:KICSTOR complex protein kaptin isoform X2 n=1 Tax=Larus michahellis TaxID=119627 RepID=UPI003D9BDAE7